MASAEKDLRYNCFGVRASRVQTLNTVAGVVTCIGLCNCFQTLVTQGLPGVVLSSIERRFSLPSTQSSWIASSYEVASIPVLLLLSFFGSRIHRPRVISFGMLSAALGCVIFCLPHFLTPDYRPEGGAHNPLCGDKSEDEDICKESNADDSRFYPLFILGRILHGVGSTPCMILGLTYLDDITTRERFSTYAGVFFAMGVVGPAIGTIGGGLLLNLFTEIQKPAPEDIDPGDPRWVGAWWLPFIIGGVLCLLAAWPIAGYPSDMPGAAEIRMNKTSEAHGEGDNETKVTDLPFDCNEIGRRLKKLFTNAPFLLISLFVVCDNIIISGFQAFGPKFVEQQFGLQASVAGSVFGGVLLPAGLAGTIIGGLLIEKMKLSCRQILKAEVILAGLVVLCTTCLFANCASGSFAGVSVPYRENEVLGNLTSGCNLACQCDNLPYEPVCAHDNIRYFSPCHAGCARKIQRTDRTEYYECGCISSLENASAPLATSLSCVTEGCRVAPVFFVAFFLSTLMMFMCMSMNMSATVRLVDSSHKSMAVPIQAVFNKLLGAIPGPIAFGIVFDGACLLWSNRCGQRGSCLMYDRWDTGRNMFLLAAGVKIASVIFMTAALVVYRPRPAADLKSLVTSDSMQAEPGSMALQTVLAEERGIDNPVYDENLEQRQNA